MKITIKDKEITLKQTFRTSMLYENITKESFGGNFSTSNFILYFYCNVLGSDQSLVLDFDEFIDILDANPSWLEEYTKWLVKVNNINEKLKGVSEDKGIKKNQTKMKQSKE